MLESLSSIFEGGGAALLNTDHSIMKSVAFFSASGGGGDATDTNAAT